MLYYYTSPKKEEKSKVFFVSYAKEKESKMGQKLPRITYYSIDAPISPLRIALLTDLHNGRVENLEDLLSEAKPDMVAIVGDLYEGPPRRERFAFENVHRVLELCAKAAPTFYAPGNHDQTLHPEVEAWLKQYHIPYLADSCIRFGEVWMGGLCSAYYKEDPTPNLEFTLEFAEKEGYKILLCHHPEYYRHYLKDTGIDLILSGHNHGGQWAFRGQGLYVPGQGLFPPHTSGVVDGRLVVSRGIYNNVAVPRIGTPTELVVVEIGTHS